MEKTLKPLPAFNDPRSQEFLRNSLEGLAAQAAKRTSDLSHQIENNRHESPLLVATADSTDAPTAVPGALWFVQNDGIVYYYDQVGDRWQAASVDVLSGNQTVTLVAAGHYLLSRVTVPVNTLVQTASIGIFSSSGMSGRIDVNQVGGGLLGSTSFSFGASLYQVVEVDIYQPFVVSSGLTVDLYITSGSLPGTDCAIMTRKIP